jgi:acetyl/propionyl-CoA carboxylase alpha subunit
VAEGGEIGIHYDPMIAKLIASGETRDIARRRAVEALRNYPILGIRTNVSFLIALLEHPRFVAGDIDIRFLDTESAGLRARIGELPTPPEVAEVAAAARLRSSGFDGQAGPGADVSADARRAEADPWATLRGFRG